MQHLMIDLETLGTKSNSVVMSIAAIPFNLYTGAMHDKPFKVNIDLNSSLEAGMEVDGKTVQWWLQQKSEVMALMFDEAVSIDTALIFLNGYIENNFVGCPVVWGNAASFDLGILKNAYYKLKIQLPWNSKNGERCYKTINQLFMSLAVEATVPEADAHNPIHDCTVQIKRLCHVWKRLTDLIDVDQTNTWNETELQNNYSESVMLLHTVMESIEAEGLPSAISTNIKTFLDGGQVFQHPSKGKLVYTWKKEKD